MNTGSDIFIGCRAGNGTLEIVISSLVLVLDMIILVVVIIYWLEKVPVRNHNGGDNIMIGRAVAAGSACSNIVMGLTGYNMGAAVTML